MIRVLVSWGALCLSKFKEAACERMMKMSQQLKSDNRKRNKNYNIDFNHSPPIPS